MVFGSLITRGQYQLRLEPPFVPGSECAGVVGEVVAFDDLPRACADLYAGRVIGKTVIEMQEGKR